jgi:hypothetical protein
MLRLNKIEITGIFQMQKTEAEEGKANAYIRVQVRQL